MARYRITYWQTIPAQVEAFDATVRVRRPLDPRFQGLIDAAAMRQGLTGTDAYLQGWHVGPELEREGEPEAVAAAVAAELEAQFDAFRASARE
ncbi:MAG: virulence factor [Armatimonadota bacterium]|nr:virulence factor [Armatimonadota bacterium]MDR7534445.1 virulence factor [Armatimonadota bacterium]MDR7535004.1 virulence factor [Armatimonadota bacterium]